jgi:hypothetical protein
MGSPASLRGFSFRRPASMLHSFLTGPEAAVARSLTQRGGSVTTGLTMLMRTSCSPASHFSAAISPSRPAFAVA